MKPPRYWMRGNARLYALADEAARKRREAASEELPWRLEEERLREEIRRRLLKERRTLTTRH